METTADRNITTVLQLSAFTQYFFPFGNFIFPAILWSLKKDQSKFVDFNGRQAINFQLSVLLYTLFLGLVAVPVIIYAVLNGIEMNFVTPAKWDFNIQNMAGIVATTGILGLTFLGLKVTEFFLIIYASVKNSNGENFKYPLTINFIK
ncbi:MAG: DUF4870 domain-containing protein [Flavobacterium sp.]|nr:MAG: DUF4870 domain-containing protein [Flavobacterium sp.]